MNPDWLRLELELIEGKVDSDGVLLLAGLIVCGGLVSFPA
jgi:hypothetical protein